MTTEGDVEEWLHLLPEWGPGHWVALLRARLPKRPPSARARSSLKLQQDPSAYEYY